MAAFHSPAMFASLPDEFVTEDTDRKSERNNEKMFSFSHTHSSLLDTDANADTIQTDDLSSTASIQHAKATRGTHSNHYWVRQLIFFIIVAATTVSLTWVVDRREEIFDDDTSDDYYFKNDFEHYLDFLRWGHSGSSEIKDSLNVSIYVPKSPLGSRIPGRKDSNDESTPNLYPMPTTFEIDFTAMSIPEEEGWASICPYSEMMQFVTGMNDDDRCNYLDPGGYVRGCTAGFYQPGMNLEVDPRPCPNGFMCPHNFVCTIACVPGTQCFNSSFDRASGNCVYPPAMNIHEAIDPLYINTIDDRLDLTSTNVSTHGIAPSSQRAVCPGAANLVLCEGGRYCKTASSSTTCSSGYFCPLGSIAPTRCPVIAKCEGDGTQQPNYGEGIILLCTVLIGTFVAALVVFQAIRSHFRMKRRSARRASKLNQHRKLHCADNKCILQDSLLDEGIPLDFPEKAEPLSSLRDKGESMIELTFKCLGITLRSNGVKVLNGVSGLCRPGRVTAIMGPSGAGKTTLMNALCGRATHGQQSGTLLVNGAEDSISSYLDLVGFVPQDDVMHDDLTVKETLLMYSGLRLPSTLTRAERIAIVADVMSVLDIREISHSVIGSVEKRGISGGQRKRVNIAIEMVADPSLLFLDEPTSGLDSNTSYSVLTALKKLSRKGANVIAVLHQPSYEIFELLDDVIFLSNGGQSAFVGPASEASSFFACAGFTCPPMLNPCDFFLDVIAGSTKYQCQRSTHFNSDDLVKLWKNQELENLSDASIQTLKPFTPRALPAGFCCSLRIFMMRAAIQQLRAYKYFISDLMLESFAGVLVGILFPHVVLADFNKWLCFMAMGLGLTISIASLRVFGNERVVFWREASFIDVSAYFISKNIVEIPRIAGLTLFFVLASYPIVTPNLEWIFCWAFCCAATFAISGFGYFVSIALNPLKAQLCTVTYVLVAVMFSGLATTSVLSFKGNPFFMTLSYLSIMRWLSELIFLRQVYSLSLAWRMPPPCYENETESSELHWLLMFGLTPVSEVFYLDVAMLLLLGITFRIFAFVSLVTCNRNKRGLRTYGQIISHRLSCLCDVWFRKLLQMTVVSNQTTEGDSEMSPIPEPSYL